LLHCRFVAFLAWQLRDTRAYRKMRASLSENAGKIFSALHIVGKLNNLRIFFEIFTGGCRTNGRGGGRMKC